MVSNNFIEECKNRANANRLGKIIVDGNEITNSDNLQSFSIDSGCYVDGNIIGTVYAKCLNANFISVPDNIILVDKEINVQVGVKYSDSSTEYINMGKYTVERPNNEKTINMSQIVAYDGLYQKLDRKYVCGIDYSDKNKTIGDLYIDICRQLELTPKTVEFTNSTIPIEDNPFTNGEKNRTVLQTICKIACAFIDIDYETNEIDLCWLSDSEEPDYTFYKSDYSTVIGGDIIFKPINCLIIKNSQIDSENITIKDDEDIQLNGEHSIVISEDYILYNEELRQLAIESIWNKVHGITYVDCELTTYYGKPFIKLGNKIRIYTSDNEYFDTYVLKHKFTYDGSYSSVIGSPALTGQEIKTKQDISLKEALFNTQIEVNKQRKQITSTIKRVDENESQIAQTQMNLTNIQNLFQITGGNNLIKNSVGLFGDNFWVKNGNFFEFGEDKSLMGTSTSMSKITISNGALVTSNDNIVGLTKQDIKTLSFKIKQDENTTTTIKLYGLDEDNPLYIKTFTEPMDWQEIYNIEIQEDGTQKRVPIQFNVDTPNLTLKIESSSLYNGKTYISDLMLNNGDKTEWQPSQSEIWGTIIKLSQMGITVFSVNGNFATLMDSNGFGVYELINGNIGNAITTFGLSGINTKEINQTGKYIQKNLVRDVIQHNHTDVYVEYIRG